MQRIIVTSLYFLTALLPLVFTVNTYELFEFPKFIVLIAGTLVVTVAWLVHSFSTQDWRLFRAGLPSWQRTIHLSILSILATQTLATIFSIHPYTSFWGYYSRFHQGLLTTFCYTILYFASVKWLDKYSVRKIIKISVNTSIVVGIIAVLEHLNLSVTCLLMTLFNHADELIFSTGCWGNLTNPLLRSFATLGQPNWLAAYLIPHIFLLIYQFRTSSQKPSMLKQTILAGVLTLALLWTNSRSGFLALLAASAAYWFVCFRQAGWKNTFPQIRYFAAASLILFAVAGTPFTQPVWTYLRPSPPVAPATPAGSTALETISTSSGDIRKIVWQGAWELIKKHPWLGTGPETFAYTYYWVRPVAHNYTTEWDYLYNKAHNEYLNIAATTGIIGLIGYLSWHFAVIQASLIRLPENKKTNKDLDRQFNSFFPVMFSAIVAFGITNFFGFSVIPVYFTMIIVSAIPYAFDAERLSPRDSHLSWLAVGLGLIGLFVFPFRIYLADVYFTQGKNLLESGKIGLASARLEKAISLRPSVDLYHSYLAEAYAAASSGDVGRVSRAVQEAEETARLNPLHLNFYKSRAKVYLSLAAQDATFYRSAAQELQKARELAPTDPKLAYNLGLVYSRLDAISEAESLMRQAIELKKNYAEPYYALALIMEETAQTDRIPALMTAARENLATYSANLKAKMDKYAPAK